MTEDKVAVTLTLDTAEFLAQLRRSVFAMYQASQWHGWPDRYHFGIRAREIGRD